MTTEKTAQPFVYYYSYKNELILSWIPPEQMRWIDYEVTYIGEL